jgi:hypothetical protein
MRAGPVAMEAGPLRLAFDVRNARLPTGDPIGESIMFGATNGTFGGSIELDFTGAFLLHTLGSLAAVRGIRALRHVAGDLTVRGVPGGQRFPFDFLDGLQAVDGDLLVVESAPWMLLFRSLQAVGGSLVVSLASHNYHSAEAAVAAIDFRSLSQVGGGVEITTRSTTDVVRTYQGAVGVVDLRSLAHASSVRINLSSAAFPVDPSTRAKMAAAIFDGLETDLDMDQMAAQAGTSSRIGGRASPCRMRETRP